jgi:hypothetical protein
MPRIPLILLGALAAASFACVAIAAALPAKAQPASSADDGCTQAAPCPIVVTVDAQGIVEGGFQVTSGDWFTLVVQNDDAVGHTVRIGQTGVAVSAAADSEASSPAFQAPAPGTYTVTDTPTGDQVPLEALSVDVVAAQKLASQSGTPGGGRKGLPGLELPALAGGLALLALLARRR